MKTPAELREAFLDKYFEAGIDDIYDELIAPALLALEDLRKQFEWYEKTFNGPDHEFQHWWRVEAPYQIDEALTAIERKLGISIYENDATKK